MTPRRDLIRSPVPPGQESGNGSAHAEGIIIPPERHRHVPLRHTRKARIIDHVRPADPIPADPIPADPINGKFIEKSCGPDERILVTTGLPLMIVVTGGFWALGFMAAGEMAARFGAEAAVSLAGTLSWMPSEAIGVLLGWIRRGFALIGLALFGVHIAAFLATRVALTTRRLVVQRGIIMLRLSEIDVDEIKGEEVDHGLLGRFFDYGRLVVDARFVTDLKLPFIARPYALLSALHAAREGQPPAPVPPP